MIYLIVAIKLALSVSFGFLIGKERKKHDKSVGCRTLSILCMSACLVAILTLKLEATYNIDFMRMMAYMIAGISFMGRGAIVKKDGDVDGLTTSATLLISVVMGFFIGLGYYAMAGISTVFIYCVLESKYWFLNNRRGNNGKNN